MEDYETQSRPLIEEEMDKNRPEFLLGGAALLLGFCAATLIKCGHPQASRGAVGLVGLCMVIVSEVMAFSLVFVVDLHFNSPMMICMPLLGLGLGLDDMFVIIRYFSGLGDQFIMSHTHAECIGEVMARAGPGVLLTSVCNAVVFFCGFFLPVRAMSWFCLCGCFVSVCNFITMVNLFMPLLVWEVSRIKRRGPDILALPCHMSVLNARNKVGDAAPADDDTFVTNSTDFKRGLEKMFVKFIKDTYAPFICKPIPAAIGTLIGIAWFVGSIVLIANASIGYSPHDLLPLDHNNYDGYFQAFNTFSLFPGKMVFTDLDVASNQVNILKAFKAISETPYTAPHSTPNFLTMTYAIMFQGTLAAAAAMGVTDQMTVATSPAFGLNMQVTGWKDQRFAPLGVLPNTTFYPIFNKFRQFPPQPVYMWGAANQSFLYADYAGVNEFAYSQGTETNTAGSKIDFGFLNIFHVSLYDEDEFVDAIEMSHKVVEAWPEAIKDHCFMYGAIPTFWEVFLSLESELFKLFGVSAAIIFTITLLFFEFDVITALITCLSCTMIVLEIYGTSVALMNFNIFVASLTLMAMGMSVEFIAHMAAAFSLETGTTQERLGHSMSSTFPALIEGSISTFCGIFPLAFHPLMFVVKFIFGIVSMVVFCGLINGLIIMPCMLGLLGPLLPYVTCKGEKAPKPEEKYADTVVPSTSEADTQKVDPEQGNTSKEGGENVAECQGCDI
jgi:hypothetical protein